MSQSEVLTDLALNLDVHRVLHVSARTTSTAVNHYHVDNHEREDHPDDFPHSDHVLGLGKEEFLDGLGGRTVQDLVADTGRGCESRAESVEDGQWLDLAAVSLLVYDDGGVHVRAVLLPVADLLIDYRVPAR